MCVCACVCACVCVCVCVCVCRIPVAAVANAVFMSLPLELQLKFLWSDHPRNEPITMQAREVDVNHCFQHESDALFVFAKINERVFTREFIGTLENAN